MTRARKCGQVPWQSSINCQKITGCSFEFVCVLCVVVFKNKKKKTEKSINHRTFELFVVHLTFFF